MTSLTRPQNDHPQEAHYTHNADLAQMEAVLTEIASQTAPTISRAVSERNKMDMRRNELERELSDFRDRRALLKAQYEAADNALMAHEVDIVEAMALFPSNVVPMEREDAA